MLLGLILIGAVACYNWFVAPHRNYLRAAERYESTAKTMERREGAIRGGIAKQKAQLMRLQKELEQAEARLFDPAGAKAFLSGFETVVRQSGCVLSSVTFSLPRGRPPATDAPGDVAALGATVTVTADYGGLITLMNQLQDRSEQVFIDMIDIRPARNAAAGLACRMNVTIRVLQDEEALTDE